MNAEFLHHEVGCGQPRKCVLQSPEYQRRGRYVFRKARADRRHRSENAFVAADWRITNCETLACPAVEEMDKTSKRTIEFRPSGQ